MVTQLTQHVILALIQLIPINTLCGQLVDLEKQHSDILLELTVSDKTF